MCGRWLRSDTEAMPATIELRRLGPYEIGAEIGRGATSQVFAGRHVGTGLEVAVKELLPGSTHPSVRARFLAEARLTASVSHRNVVYVHDFLQHDDGSALVLEHAKRGTLRQHVRGGLGLAQVGGVLEDVLAGLAALERRRILHLDVKPDNLLVTARGRTVIADFGAARTFDPVAHPADGTKDGTEDIVGTPAYLAPERVTRGRVGPWTDLYAVGTLAYVLLVGRAPFADSPDPVDVVRRQIHEPVPRVCDVVPGVSPLVADWIDWLVAKSPADRPHGAAEAWGGLEHVLTAVLGTSWRLAAGV